jgi:hypothetical protein
MLPTSTRIFVCTQPVDMRSSFDGLARCTRELLERDPSSARSGPMAASVVPRTQASDPIQSWAHNGHCTLRASSICLCELLHAAWPALGTDTESWLPPPPFPSNCPITERNRPVGWARPKQARAGTNAEGLSRRHHKERTAT